jgi:hypothetical protein
MITDCQHINDALKLLEDEGNAIIKVAQWGKMNKVIFMRDKLSDDLRTKIQSQIKKLDYWNNEKNSSQTSEGRFSLWRA